MASQETTSEAIISKTREEIIKEAKRIEESSLYSCKGHLEAAAFWRNFHIWLGLPATALAAVAAASAFSQFDKGNNIGGWISIVVAVLSGLSTFLNPNQKAAAHFIAGNNFDALQTKARIFWTVDCQSNDSDAVLTKRLKDLAAEKTELNKKSPQIPRFAYKAGKKGIEAGEAGYAVDKPENSNAS